MSNPTDASLRSDEPIHRAEQDQLARTRLVDVIGKHILETSAPESVVIALNAPWGAGKTSFLNLLERRLVPEVAGSDPTPIIVRFNPWNYGNIDQLNFSCDVLRGARTWCRNST